MRSVRRRNTVALAGVWSLALATVVWATDARTVVKPGWNMFSPQQDVEVGQQLSPDAERQLPMLKNARVDDYANALGQRLAVKAPGQKFPYHFKVVNDRAINAFALPGGPIYINRGAIEAADNESQLAGVMAHEAAHVALRHGTNQASKASAAQLPLSILGGLIGSDSTKSALTQLGASFAVNSILLKYSRTAESQADILGTQILFDSGYDPRAMAQFFRKIEAQQNGSGPVEFLSNHPSPDNRIERVNQEIAALGGVRPASLTNSRAFDDIKRHVLSLPSPSPVKGQPAGAAAGATGTAPEWPSERFVGVQGSLLRINHPDNWQARGQGDAMTITPRGGLIDDGEGQQALARGVIVNLFEPRAGGGTLEQATDQLVQELRLSNRNMRVIRYREVIRVDGARALSTYLSNDSPVGGRETDWLISMTHPEGLLFVVFTAPEREFQRYESAFHEMLRSIRIKR